MTSRSIGFAGVYPDGTNTGAAMANIDGVQVAVLAYTYGLSDEGRERTRDDSRGVVAMMDSQRVVRDITQARTSSSFCRIGERKTARRRRIPCRRWRARWRRRARM